jgi:hypothetical protein
MRLPRLSLPQVILFILILAALLFTRFFHLGTVPTAVSHDEMIYSLNAQSLAFTGTNITGEWNPWSLTPIDENFAELPGLLMAPFYRLPVAPLVANRLPYVLISLLLPVIIGGLTARLTKSRGIGFWTGLIAAFNPWIWQFGRMGFDPSWSLLFQLLGGWLFLALPDWRKLWSLPVFFLGFYQYQGHKLVFIPWILLLAAWQIYEAQPVVFSPSIIRRWRKIDWRRLYPILAVVLAAGLLFLFYISWQLPRQASLGRVSKIVTPDYPSIRQAVDGERRIALLSPFTSVAVNKYTLWIQHLSTRFLDIYNPMYWFRQGQGNLAVFSVWSHGQFYLVDLGLLLVGIVALARRKPALLVFLAFGFLAAPLPALITPEFWLTFRASFAIPFFLILMGAGADEIWRQWPRWLSWLIGGVYLVFILQFAFIYFVRYPVYSSAKIYYLDKVLVEYINRLEEKPPVRVLTREPSFVFRTFAYYAQLFKTDRSAELQRIFRANDYRWDNLVLSPDCYHPAEVATSSAVWIIRTDAPVCPEDKTPVANDHLSISAIDDSGEYYFIYNDPLCEGVELSSFVRITSLQEFDLPNLSDEQFCRTWIKDLRPLKPAGVMAD